MHFFQAITPFEANRLAHMVELMIAYNEQLFEPPTVLLHDVALYWRRRARAGSRKMMFSKNKKTLFA